MRESYTYSFKQFRIIIKKIGNLYTFAIINQDTNEFFQSQETELKRISQQTLTAAFNDKVKNITNQIVYEDSDHLKITIKVSLDFLPQFCQDILLNKVQKGEEQVQKIHYLELQNQIKTVQKQLQWQFDVNNKKKVMVLQKSNQTQTLNEIDNILWKLNVQKGEYLIQCCGCCLSQQNTPFMFGGSGVAKDYQTKSNILFSVNLNKDCIYSMNCRPFDYCGYEYPFLFSFIMHVQQQSELSIIGEDFQKKIGVLNNCTLILSKIKCQIENDQK